MTRSKKELESSRARIQAGLRALQVELENVERELAALRPATPMNETFFWNSVVPALAEVEGGLSTKALREKLMNYGHAIAEANFRTFLSRNKSKGNLVSLHHGGAQSAWRLSASAAQKAAALGYQVAGRFEE